ncbi:MAG: right-handed parallel beta-helix repeat-containing protein [Thermoplasmata archaeon]|nr:right-handed parallel beta-helix repeat-containing protein [Thermoplasmata archaeon]
MNKTIAAMVAILLFIPFASINGNKISLKESKGNGEGIIYVGGNGEGNYTTIQEAIDAASNGYTIYVYPGNYNESIVINKSISLIGIEKEGERPIIDGGGNRTAVNITADGCKIKNFKIINFGDFSDWPPSEWGMSIEINSRNNLVENNIIQCNWDGIRMSSPNNMIVNNTISKAWWTGIVCWEGNNTIIYNNISHNPYAIGVDPGGSNNTVAWNIITHNYHGIDFIESNNNISHNIISYNRQGGIMFSHGSHNKILYNEICHNGQEGLIAADTSYNIIAHNNISSNGRSGIVLKSAYSSPLITYGNIIYRNMIAYNKDKGVYLLGSGSNNSIVENNIVENGINARFSFYRHSYEGHPYENTWDRNYWSDWRFSLPKPIFGRIWEPFRHKWVVFDFNPAMEPYEI